VIDWDEVEQIAFGQLGWRPEDFEKFDFREFRNARLGNQLHTEQFWLMARTVCYYSGNHKAKKPSDLFPSVLDEMMKKNKPKEEKKIATVRRIDG